MAPNGAEEVRVGHLRGTYRRGTLHDAVPKWSSSAIGTALSGVASGVRKGRLNGAEEVQFGHLRWALRRSLLEAVQRDASLVAC